MSETISWRTGVLNELSIGLADCFIVEDPDSLMTESGIQTELLARGYSFYPFTDPIEFRYFYESQIHGRTNDPLVISVDGDTITSRHLPFDVTQNARVLCLSLNEYFPDIHPNILHSLPIAELDTLYQAIHEYTPGRLNEAASADFALRHLYQIATEIIQSPTDLLRTLLRTHYRNIVLPLTLSQRITERLQRKPAFAHWPLPELLGSRQTFFAFLQTHWATYLEATAESLDKGANEPETSYWQAGDVTKSVVLPFGHDDVRIYIDTLFLEGFLHPIEREQTSQFSQHWSMVGIQHDPDKQQRRRARGLLKLCQETLPKMDAYHPEWLQFAHRWAELSSLYYTRREWVDESAYLAFRSAMDRRFQNWMLEKYVSLPTQPPNPPAMLHHIPRVMARELSAAKFPRLALIVIDGLALDQWVSLQQELALLQDENNTVTESSVFAWVPTLTSVSRQALFAAKSPYQFTKTIHTTSAEKKLWQQFWIEQGLRTEAVFYTKGLGTDNVEELLDHLSDHRLQAAALVINTVDDTMHGMTLGSAGMHSMVRQWAKSGYLNRLLQGLLDEGYGIYLTADHGNVEAMGCGKVTDGATADARGERVRIYSTSGLRAQIKDTIDPAIDWPQTGLPADYWPLLLEGRNAFVREGEGLVGHGGIALEEVIVPYIKISRG